MKYLLMDIDGVLIRGMHYDPRLRRPWDEHLKKDLGICPEDLSRVFFKPYFHQVLAGEVALEKCLEELMPHLNPNCSAKTLIQYWQEGDSKVEEPLLLAIDRLKGKFKRLLLSNQEPGRASYIWNTLKFSQFFDGGIFSYQLGFVKPDPKFFHSALGVLDLNSADASDIFYFDDDPRNIEVASELGWNATHYQGVNDFFKHPEFQVL